MSDHIAIINETLDRIKQRENLTETALARRLDVDPATIWRWRGGDVGKAAAILIPLVAQPEHAVSERAA